MFSDFIAEEARIACNPISSLHALKGGDEKTRLKVHTLATSAKVTKKSKNREQRDEDSSGTEQDSGSSDGEEGSKKSKRQPKCPCCKEKHFIYKCKKFTALSHDEKKRVILDNKMCYACLRIGHQAKECRNRATCNICKRSHPTPLHEERPQKETENPQPDPPKPPDPPEESASNNSVKVNKGERTSMIVPVWLSCDADFSPEILVYAFLDTQSSNTFVDRDVCERLGAKTEHVKLKLSTMTDEGTIVKCQRASGLKVRGYYSKKHAKIDLPPAYTREHIRLEQDSIPTRDTARRWTHLLPIEKELPHRLDCPAGLLIGYDCVRALEPTQVISGKKSSPYAIQTELGWSIIGAPHPL